MKATLIQIGPSKAATEAGRKVLCPEMNAAVAARHSRTSEGLDHILDKVDNLGDEDRAIDSVFQFIDFGHRSIADMIPVSIHIEGVSIWLAEFLWGLVHVGGGQETSTRYCNMSDADYFAPPNLDLSSSFMDSSAEAYALSKEFWGLVADEMPEMVGIDKEMDLKVVARYKRNFVFDRSRYFIPSSCLTNLNITTWGTEWIRIIQSLCSNPWNETLDLANLIRDELKLISPRLIKHTWFNECRHKDYENKLTRAIKFSGITKTKGAFYEDLSSGYKTEDAFQILLGKGLQPTAVFDASSDDAEDKLGSILHVHQNMKYRKNRYDPVGSDLSIIPVSYGWRGVTQAEIRDMNRHRPGVRNISLRPEGFYFAEDQINRVLQNNPSIELRDKAMELVQAGLKVAQMTLSLSNEVLNSTSPWNVVYSTVLGNTFSFSHTSTFGHLIYECELRTGPGTHYRYRDHYLQLLEAVYKKFPLIKEFVLEGSGEPE